MEEYFKALDYYIDLKIKYAKFDLENDLAYRREFHLVANAKSDMQVQFMILMNNKQDYKKPEE